MTQNLSLRMQLVADSELPGKVEASEAAAQRLRQDLMSSGLPASVSPLRGPAQPGARSGEAVIAGALLLEIAPVVLEQLFEMIRQLFQRPGAPNVKILVRDGESETAIEFDPRRLDLDSVSELAKRLRAQL